MSIKKCGVVLVLLALLAGVAAASAGAASVSKKPVNNGFTVVSGYDAQPVKSLDMTGTVSAMTVYTIVQGQTNYHPKYIGPGCYYYYVDINWGNTANSLRLTIIAPDDTVIGTFYDSSDGRTDGRIYLRISYGGQPLPVGTYDHYVYGYKVTGIEDYTV
ncbi:hypothetical protein [Methanocella conradii]|uniref:hypothetical protein n=1 Tax=Methanocella conradii TaxID=1175444 RepID=UPI0024B3879A|nr:hypothetical protein [Methanocella conradii]MDI6895960.1 hypothetical protein [Methanocella conradii]